MSALPAVDAPHTIHASAAVVGEDAVVIRGASGGGKSALALALVEAARARGIFARLVADDRVRLRVAGGRLIVAPHPAIAGRVERRFAGIASVEHEEASVARLLVDLAPVLPSAVARLPGEAASWDVVAGIRLPRLVFPAGHSGAVETILNGLQATR